MSAYFDYRFRFPTAGLAAALGAFAALRKAGLLGAGDLGAGDLPDNMLGDYRDASGAAVDASSGAVAWVGRQGSAGAGDAAQFYVAIRSTIAPSRLAAAGFDPSAYGLAVCDPAENAAVLGVWA